VLSNAVATLHNNAAKFRNLGPDELTSATKEWHEQPSPQAADQAAAQESRPTNNANSVADNLRDNNMMILNYESEKDMNSLKNQAMSLQNQT